MRSIILCLIFVFAIFIGRAQHPIVSYGNSLITFGASIEVTDLPTPEPYSDYPDSDLYYSGEGSELNQYAQFDDFNNLLFFIVDGNIYDGSGYLIAKNYFYANSEEIGFNEQSGRHIAMTGSDLAITNIPGFCD